jgi:hypothetical protein
MPATLDHSTLARLVESRAVRATQVVGQPGGWGVVVKSGKTQHSLAATRSGEVRVFKKLETLVGYLKALGIHQFDVDAAQFDAHAVTTTPRPDASKALKRAHEAAAYGKWFQEQVAEAIKEAADPSTQWVSNETAKAEMAQRRAAWRKKAAMQVAAKSRA